jgi:D-sedoheptulose 7-phosphate isomerase
MSVADDLDFCFTVHSQSIHRIQESHAILGYRLWAVAQEQIAFPTNGVQAS